MTEASPPDDLALHAHRLLDAGRFLEAAEAWAEIARRDPAAAGPVIARSAALVLAGDAAGAIQAVAEALPRVDDKATLWVRAGILHRHVQDPERAMACFREALAVHPGYPPAHLALAEDAFERLHLDAARAHMHQALAQAPPVQQMAIHQTLGELGPTLEIGARLIHERREDPTPLVHLGRALQMRGRLIDAASAFAQALERDPLRGDALFGLAECQIHLGDPRRGWATFARAANPGLLRSLPGEVRPGFDRLWRGEPVSGKRMLVVNMLGLGDNLMALRYAQVLQALGAHVTWLCQAKLQRLYQGARGVDEVAPMAGHAAPWGAYDYWCLDHLLAGRLGAAEGQIPAWEDGYLPQPASPPRPTSGRLRVGLCWSSGGQHFTGHARFIAPEDLAPLADVPGVDWVVVQQTRANAELAARSGLAVEDRSGEWDDLQDAAAAMAGLDLVISVCSGPLHLAGALGKEVWGLISAAPDWRWGLTGDRTPWYPRMRLFRQETLYDWSGVVAEVKTALISRLTSGPQGWGGSVGLK